MSNPGRRGRNNSTGTHYLAPPERGKRKSGPCVWAPAGPVETIMIAKIAKARTRIGASFGISFQDFIIESTPSRFVLSIPRFSRSPFKGVRSGLSRWEPPKTGKSLSPIKPRISAVAQGLTGCAALRVRNRHEGRELFAERQKSILTGLFGYEKHRERDRRDHRQGNA
jgi:hypothetical protein